MQARRQEMLHKHQMVASFLAAHSPDAVALTQRHNFAWFTAGGLNHVVTASETGVASLVVSADSVICVTNTIEGPRMMDEELGELEIPVKAVEWFDDEAGQRHWNDLLGGRKVACDACVSGMPDEIQSLPKDFAQLRWALTPGEIERYRATSKEVAAGLEAASREARHGMTEYELAAKVMADLMERGIRAPVVLIAADDRVARYRHPIPTARKFEKYGMAVACGEREGLIVSNTRLFSFGAIPENLQRRHEAVCRVDTAMIANTRPGKTLCDIFSVAQSVYAETGYADEWQLHHQGGSAGYLGREVKATPTCTTGVLLHQAFAWNPSIAGTKSEDTILVGHQSNEILSDTGQWPRTRYSHEGTSCERCDILTL